MQKEVEKKLFFLLDNCISIDCVKLSLLRREYLSSAVNVLIKSYKLFHIAKMDIFEVIYLQMITRYSNDAVLQIAKVFGPPSHVACQRVP